MNKINNKISIIPFHYTFAINTIRLKILFKKRIHDKKKQQNFNHSLNEKKFIKKKKTRSKIPIIF